MVNVFKREKLFLFFIFLFAFLLRGLFFNFYLSKSKNYLVGDFIYNTVAKQVYIGNGISHDYKQPEFIRLPFYPLFLGLNYKIFEGSETKTLWVQLFLSSFIPILVFFLVLVLFPNNFLIAKTSSIISCIHLGYIFFSGVIFTESLFTLFFLLFLILFLNQMHLFFCKKNIENSSSTKLFVAGLILGICSLIRPVGQYLIFLSLLMILFSTAILINKIKKILLFFIGWFSIVIGWLVRNYILAGFIFFTSLPGVHFYFFSANYIVSQSKNISLSESKDYLDKESRSLFEKEEKKKGEDLIEIEKCYLYEKLTLSHLKKHPFLFIKHSIINCFKTTCFPFFNELYYTKGLKDDVWCRPATTFLEFIKKFFIPRSNCIWLLVVMYFDLFLFLFLLFGFIGFILKSIFAKKYLCVIIKSFPFISLFISLTLACGYPRLRLPVEAFIIIFATHFWIKISTKFLNKSL